MSKLRWLWDWVALLALCVGHACGRPEGSGDHAAAVSREVESRILPPGASSVTLGPAEIRPCAIRTEWTFATSWNRARYGEWLKARLLPDFTTVKEAPGELAFSRYVGGAIPNLCGLRLGPRQTTSTSEARCACSPIERQSTSDPRGRKREISEPSA